jgi:hypothetical protein
MKNVLGDIENDFQTRELIISILLTLAFLSLGFIGCTRFSTIVVPVDTHGLEYTIHVSYYGYPFAMTRVLNPIGEDQTGWALYSGVGLVQMLWGGLVLNFVLYFLLAFAIVYLLKKVKLRVATWKLFWRKHV